MPNVPYIIGSNLIISKILPKLSKEVDMVKIFSTPTFFDLLITSEI